MKEIKLIIDGKEIAVLTAEQIKALGIDDGCVCDRVAYGDNYCYITAELESRVLQERDDGTDVGLFECGNYYRDESYAKQVALHQKLNNLLRRYSEQHGGDAEWDGVNNHFSIFFEFGPRTFYAAPYNRSKQCGAVYFGSLSVAEKAIEEVAKPFIKEHPDFVW